ncbi:MAG TPA: nucleotidyltransferase [Pyrinomonadaceae bacterium]|nr:nucleotidyltransferase [Pyrinomonadaceae bacterium]
MNELTTDFIDFLTILVDGKVDFVVVGGYAVSFHGHPRATKDLDVFVRAEPTNAKRLYNALADFGAPLHQFEVAEEDFSDYGGVLQLGIPPQRIDIINRITGVSYDEAVAESEMFELDGRRIPVIGLKALVKNKLATGRGQDLLDAQNLSRVQR